MKYSLLLSLACATALLASTTSAGAYFSSPTPEPVVDDPPPVPVVDTPPPVPVVDDPPPARWPNFYFLSDEDFEALKAGEKYTQFSWPAWRIQIETDRREYAKKYDRERSLIDCVDDTFARQDKTQVRFITAQSIASLFSTRDISFIDERIKNVSEQTFFGALKRAINENNSVVVRVFLERGQSNLSRKKIFQLIKHATSCKKNGNALKYIDYSTVDLEVVIILALKSIYHRTEETVDMLLAKKGPDFTGGKLLLAAVRQMSTWCPSEDGPRDQPSALSVMVRLLNEGDMDTKYDNYAALKHLSLTSSDSNLRYFLKAGKVDPSDLKDGEFPDVVKDGEILNVDYLRKLVANEPPKGWGCDNYLQDEYWRPNKYTNRHNKWELQYYPGAEAK